MINSYQGYKSNTVKQYIVVSPIVAYAGKQKCQCRSAVVNIYQDTIIHCNKCCCLHDLPRGNANRILKRLSTTVSLLV